MKVQLACGLLLLLPGISHAETLSCRSQVAMVCQASCKAENQPADLTLDFEKKTGSFCRGEKCNDGVLDSIATAGQWDEKEYLSFRLSGRKSGNFEVTGSVTPGRSYFAAVSNEIGYLAGSCKAN